MNDNMKRDLAFGRMNFILLAVSMVVVVIGFILMSGGSSTEEAYNPDIFSTRRIVVAPVVYLLGFLSMIYAVVHKSKDEVQKEETK
jgi:membrane-bound ClpP family serine protease